MAAILARKSKPAAKSKHGQPSDEVKEIFREGLRSTVAELLRAKYHQEFDEVASIANIDGEQPAVEAAARYWNGVRINAPDPSDLKLVCDATAVDVCNAATRLAVLSYYELLPTIRGIFNEGKGSKPAKKPLVEWTDAEWAAHNSKGKKSSHGPLPAGIAANDPDAGERWQETPNAAVVVFDTDELMRHPDNREPTEQDIIAKMMQFQKEGQLEPVVLWPPPKDWSHRQGEKLVIISGETRWHAAKRLGWKLQGRIAEGLTPAEALERLAAYNGERRDLDPMQKARLINRLCQSVAEGGAGLTRQAAGERVGLESGAAASNLVRLLELPKKWQDRVASGELAWTWAREMIPYIPVFQAIDEELDRDWKNRETDRWDNAFESRAALNEQLQRIVDEACPRLDRREIWIGSKHHTLKVDVKDPDTIAKLGIVELELPTGKKGQTEKVPVATNEKAFDKLVAEFKANGAKASAEKAGRDDKPAKRELSAAEKKQKAADRTKQLSERLVAWRDKLLRRVLLEKLDAREDSGFRLVMAYAGDPAHMVLSFGRLLELATHTKPTRDAANYRNVFWKSVATAIPGMQEADLSLTLAMTLLQQESQNWKSPVIPFDLTAAYAAELEVDVAAAWRRMQETVRPSSGAGRLAGEDLLEEFLLFHTTDELRALALEMGKHVLNSTAATKAGIIKTLLSVPRGSNQRLPLPKSIKPLAGVKPAKGKKGAK